MSLNDRLRKLEKQQPADDAAGVVIVMPDNGRGSQGEQEAIRTRWAEYKRTGVVPKGSPLLIIPQDAPEHKEARQMPAHHWQH